MAPQQNVSGESALSIQRRRRRGLGGLTGMAALMLTQNTLWGAPWTISMTSSEQGTVTPLTTNVVGTDGGSVSFEVAATNVDYHIAEIFTNGVAVGMDGWTNGEHTVTMSNIWDHGTIHAQFVRNDVVEFILPNTNSLSGSSILPATLYLDIPANRGFAMTGSMPVDNSSQWEMARTNGWSWPPLTGATPVSNDTRALIVAYPSEEVPTAPLDLNLAVLPGGSALDIYWRDSDPEDTESYCVELCDLDGDGIFRPVSAFGLQEERTNGVAITAGHQYLLRISSIGNGFASLPGYLFSIETYVTNGTPIWAVQRASTNDVGTLVAFNQPLDSSLDSIGSVSIHGALTGTRTASVSLSNSGRGMEVAIRDASPGEPLWLVSGRGLKGVDGDVAVPRSWRVWGDVRFGGGEFSDTSWPGATYIVDAAAGMINTGSTPDIVSLVHDTEDNNTLVIAWDGQLLDATFQALPAGAAGRVFSVDVDGDGRNEILYYATSGTLSTWWYDGSGLSNGASCTVGPLNDFEAADMDLDGDLDVLVASANGVQCWRNNGMGRLEEDGEPIPAGVVNGLAVTDVNQDGWPDVVTAADVGSTNGVWQSTGNGRFIRQPQVWDALGPNTLAAYDVLAADYIGSSYGDKDGREDLLLLEDSRRRRWKNIGEARFDDWGSSSYGVSAKRRGLVGDVDGDGRPDAIVASEGSDQCHMLSGFVTRKNLSVKEGARPALGDFNGDGALDIFLGDPGGENDAVCLYNLPPPRRVAVDIHNIQPTSFEASWSVDGEATNYTYEVWDTESTPSRVAGPTPSGGPIATNASIASLTDFAAYMFRVKPVGVNGEGDWTAADVYLGHYASISATQGGTVMPVGYVRIGDGIAVACTGSLGYAIQNVQVVPSGSATVTGFPGGPPPWHSAEIDINPGQANQTHVSFAWDPEHAVSPEWLNTFAVVGDSDPDGDGLKSWQEFYAGTDPTNTASSLRITGFMIPGEERSVTFDSVSGKRYVLQGAPVPSDAAFGDLSGLATGSGQPLTLQTPTGDSNMFYRIRLEIAP